jgi:hypothetical protein
MHSYRHFRVWCLVASLYLVLPLMGGCGNESDSNGTVDGRNVAAAARALAVVAGDSCVLGTTHLACAAPAVLMDCVIQMQEGDAQPTAATCCLKPQSNPVPSLTCTPATSCLTTGGGLRPQTDNGPGPNLRGDVLYPNLLDGVPYPYLQYHDPCPNLQDNVPFPNRGVLRPQIDEGPAPN